MIELANTLQWIWLGVFTGFMVAEQAISAPMFSFLRGRLSRRMVVVLLAGAVVFGLAGWAGADDPVWLDWLVAGLCVLIAVAEATMERKLRRVRLHLLEAYRQQLLAAGFTVEQDDITVKVEKGP